MDRVQQIYQQSRLLYNQNSSNSSNNNENSFNNNIAYTTGTIHYLKHDHSHSHNSHKGNSSREMNASLEIKKRNWRYKYFHIGKYIHLSRHNNEHVSESTVLKYNHHCCIVTVVYIHT